jgi:NADH pyrophosphatase NudC (nudix superfamily)
MERSLSGLERGPGKLVYRKVPRVRIPPSPPNCNIKNMEYKFCPKCGNEAERKLSNLLVCKKCDYNYYINPSPTNGLILENSKGEILLVKRKFEPKKGYLDVAGGFVEPGESLEESSIREAKEELGVEITDVKYFRSYSDEYLFQGVNIKTIGFILTARIINEENIKPADDVEEVLFFPKDSVPLEKIAFESIKQGLLDYINLK